MLKLFKIKVVRTFISRKGHAIPNALSKAGGNLTISVFADCDNIKFVKLPFMVEFDHI